MFTDLKTREIFKHLKQFKDYLIVLTVGIFTISLRFYNATIVQGFDTPVYVYSSRLIDKGNLYIMYSSTKLLAFFISWVIFKISGNSIILTGFLLPYVFGSVLLVLTIKAVKMGYNDSKLAVVIGLVTALSYTFIRVTYDLFAQTLGLGVLYITLTSIAQFYKEKEFWLLSKAKEGVLFLLILYMSHFYTAVLVTMFFFVIFVLKIVTVSKQKKGYISLKSIIVILILSISISISFLILRWDYVTWLLTVVIPNEFKFFGVTIDSFWLLKQDNLFFWTIVIIGVYVIVLRRNAMDVVIGLWGLFIIALTIITGYVQTYRFLLLIPTTFYAGIGLFYLYNMLCSEVFQLQYTLVKKLVKKQKFIAILIVFIFFIGLSINTIQKGYISQFVYYPNQEIESQLMWIENNFGFDNQNILVPIFAPYNKNYLKSWTANVEGWSLAYLGTVIFRGSVLEAISGVPNVYDNQYIPGVQKIILADKLYHLGSIERHFSKEIYPGIYLFDASIGEINDFIRANYVWIRNSFKDDFVFYKSSSLNATINANKTVHIELSEGANKGSITLKIKGIGVYIRDFNDFIMNISGHLEYTILSVKLHFADGTSLKTRIDRVNTDNYNLHVVPIQGYKFLTDIEISLVRTININYPTENIFITYLAIV